MSVPPLATPLTVITDDQRRWVVIGICLNKLLTPVLRTVLGPEIPIWYNSLCLSPNPINKQTYKKHETKLLPSTVKLNYGNINKNYDNHKLAYSAYDYDVKDPESLAKLFVQPFMAKFTGFDQTMDLSAALTLISEADPFHLSGAAAQANIVRSNVRNKWAHCDFSHWSEKNYHTCIQHIETLVKKLNLSSADEKDFVNELNNWKDKGKCLIHVLIKMIMVVRFLFLIGIFLIVFQKSKKRNLEMRVLELAKNTSIVLLANVCSLDH